MNIGETVKQIKKRYPSVTISRLRFLEREGLINPKRSKGGTRNYTNKDIERIIKILSLQEDNFYSLKAIKNNKQLLSSTSNQNIKIKEYSKHDALKKSGLSDEYLADLIEFNFEKDKKIYSQNDVDRLAAFAYFYNLGLTAKNFSLMKNLSERGSGFFDIINTSNELSKNDLEIAINNFSLIIGSYILEES
tara:strand:- start:522 stop:1094 length:573 start_codon:yes stop_codon:yes gene_type:complete